MKDDVDGETSKQGVDLKTVWRFGDICWAENTWLKTKALQGRW